MKKILMLLIISLLFTTGCYVYGTGKTYGYVTTVEDGVFWDKVWIRAELESSQTDCYVIEQSNTFLQDQLSKTSMKRQRIQMNFKRHIAVAAECNNDEVVGYSII